MSKIRFGTNGWRGVLGRDFTAEGAERLARALARALGATPRVMVAHDTREQASEVAARSARALAEAGAAVLACNRAVPTPVAGFLVRARRADAGPVVTASHNPAGYLGVKILGPAGDGAPRSLLDALAADANAESEPQAASDGGARVLRAPGCAGGP